MLNAWLHVRVINFRIIIIIIIIIAKKGECLEKVGSFCLDKAALFLIMFII